MKGVLILVGVAAVAAVLGLAHGAGRKDGVREAEKAAAPVIAGLQVDLSQCRSTVATQRAALVDQNAAIDRLAAEGEARARIADAALRQAQGEADRYRQRARQIAAAKPVGGQCEAAQALIVKTLSEDRR